MIIAVKGSAKSGNYGHAGIPGKVGGSQKKSTGVVTATTPVSGIIDLKPSSDKLLSLKDDPTGTTRLVDKVEDVKTGKMGRGYFILGEDIDSPYKGKIVDITGEFSGGSNDHPGFVAGSTSPELFGMSVSDANKLYRAYTTDTIMSGDWMAEGWDKIFQSGAIRVRQFGKPVNLDTKAVDTATMRKLQTLYDDGKLDFKPHETNYWVGTDDKTVRFTLEDLLNSRTVEHLIRTGERSDWKEKRMIIAVKGSAKSGNHGHGGRPGKVGGSTPKPKAVEASTEPALPTGEETYKELSAMYLDGLPDRVSQKYILNPDTLKPARKFSMAKDGVANFSKLDSGYFGSSDSLRVNKELRSGVAIPEFDKFRAPAGNWIKLPNSTHEMLEDFRTGSIPLPHDVKTFRAVRDTPDSVFAKAQVGDIIQDRGFVSTTMVESYAKGFNPNAITPFGMAKSVAAVKVLEIKVPKGTKYATAAKEEIKYESELLLGPGTKFKVVSVEPMKLEVVE